MAKSIFDAGSTYDPMAALDPSAAPSTSTGGGLFGNPAAWQQIIASLGVLGDSRRQVNPRPTSEILAPLVQLWGQQAQNNRQEKALQQGMALINNGPPTDFMTGDDGTAAPGASPAGAPGGLFADPRPTQSGMSAGGALGGGTRGGKIDFTTARQLAQQAGFQGDSADKIAAISLAESGGDPNAHGDLNLGNSYGITQINEAAHGPIARTALGDPLQAMKLAYGVSKGGTDFSPWTMYKNGGYQKFLPAAAAGGAPSATPIPTQGAGRMQLASATPQTMNDAGTGASQPQQSSPLLVGDSIAGHMITFGGAPGATDRRTVGKYSPGLTAVNGFTPSQILDTVIPGIPDEQIRGRNVVLSTGASNDPSQLQIIPKQIQALKQRGASGVTLAGVGTAPQLRGVNDALSQIASNTGTTFAGPLRNVGSDGIHSADPQAEFNAVRAAAQPQGQSSAAPATQLAQAQPPAAAAPTTQDVAQARAAVQAPPPPNPQTVSGQTSQQAAALKYFEYYARIGAAFAPLGDAGKGITDYAKAHMDLAKDYLSEASKKRLELQYSVPLTQAKEGVVTQELYRRPDANVALQGQLAGAKEQASQQAKYLGPDANVALQGQLAGAKSQATEQAKYLGPEANVNLQGALDQAKANAQAAANTKEHMATQYGANYDPANPQAGVSPIPNFTALNATNKAAQAAAEANAQLGPKIAGETAGNYSKLGAEDLFKRRAVAQDAAESLRQSQEARALIGDGINTGPFAQWKQSFDRVLGDNHVAANTEAFVAARATEVGRLIKQFGSGTGLSDADREYASQMAAGKIGLTKQSILSILDMNDRASRNLLQRYNSDAQNVPNGLVPYPMTVQPSAGANAAPIVTPYGTIRQVR